MGSRLYGLLRIFLHGMGLRISLAFLPPIALAWIFFITALYLTSKFQPDGFYTLLLLGLLGIALGSVVVFWLILSTIPALREVVSITHSLADGDLSVEFAHVRFLLKLTPATTERSSCPTIIA